MKRQRDLSQSDVSNIPSTNDGASGSNEPALSRRAALQGLGIGLGAVAIGCGGSDGGLPGPDPSGSGTGEPPTTTSSPTDPPGTSAPTPPTTPEPPKLGPKELLAGIEQIVVLVM